MHNFHFNPYTDHILPNYPPLKPQTSVPSGKYIITYCEQASSQFYTSVIAIVSMLYRYSRQLRTYDRLNLNYR